MHALALPGPRASDPARRPATNGPAGSLRPPVAAAIGVLRRPGALSGGALAHDEAEALAVIYRAYSGMLLSVARRLVGPDDGPDVVHDVFCRLPQSVAQYRDGGLGGWLKQCVVRAALMRLRTARRRGGAPGLSPEWRAEREGDHAEPADAYHEMREEVRWAVEQLPEPQRRVVLLRVFGDCTHQEIAARLGITPTASEVRLCRAMKRLRALLRPAADADPRPSGARKATRGGGHPMRRRAAPPARRSTPAPTCA